MKDIDCLIMAALKTDLAKENMFFTGFERLGVDRWGGGSPSFPALPPSARNPVYSYG